MMVKKIYSEPRLLIPKNNNFEYEIYNLIKIATFNQTLYHAIIYGYDDSIFEEIFDSISNEELENFIKWVNLNIKDKKRIKKN